MYQIPWKEYTEEEIQEVLTAIFEERGYEVYNIHKVDRRGEDGVDLECTRSGEAEKVLISAKKHPRKKDVNQLNKFADKLSKTKIYVFIGEPSSAFKEAMEKVKHRVSFWDSKKLTYEIFLTDIRFYLFLIIENYFEKDIYEITLPFSMFYYNFAKNGPKYGKPFKANNEMLSLLWNIKDRSASLHKSLRNLQTLFEEMNQPKVEEKNKMHITRAFLKALSYLHKDSLKPLRELYLDFLKKYPANFEQFCRESKGSSYWKYLLEIRPKLLPRFIIESFKEEKKIIREMKEKISQEEVTPNKEHVNETLGDIARILANEAYWLEDTVDNLFKIGLTGKCR
jgi:hypothetical protein